MPKFIFKQIQKRLKNKAKILFLGITFKEDVPDLRNSKAIELLIILKILNLIFQLMILLLLIIVTLNIMI